MNFLKTLFSILNKDRREIDFIKEFYKRRFQCEIEYYKDSDDEDKKDKIQAQDSLFGDRISI